MQSVVMAVLMAVLFVAGEGCMIWYLLKGIGERTGLLRCISYSFIGFFFSGITPSATGEQPVQLYYMKKDGNKISSASVVLMAVAVIFKFVLVLKGTGIILFWREPLREYLKGYYWVYFLGLFLNIAVVLVLVLVMFTPGIIRRIFYKTEKILIFFKVWKKSDLRKDRMDQFLSEYQETVGFLRSHKKNDNRYRHWYVPAKGKRLSSYLCSIPGTGFIWNSFVRYYSAAGFRLYSGRYAASTWCAGNYGSNVWSCF